jgi:hypothetical protein
MPTAKFHIDQREFTETSREDPDRQLTRIVDLDQSRRLRLHILLVFKDLAGCVDR